MNGTDVNEGVGVIIHTGVKHHGGSRSTIFMVDIISQVLVDGHNTGANEHQSGALAPSYTCVHGRSRMIYFSGVSRSSSSSSETSPNDSCRLAACKNAASTSPRNHWISVLPSGQISGQTITAAVLMFTHQECGSPNFLSCGPHSPEQDS